MPGSDTILTLRDWIGLIGGLSGLISASILWFVTAKIKGSEQNILETMQKSINNMKNEILGNVREGEIRVEKQVESIKATMVTKQEAQLVNENIKLQMEIANERLKNERRGRDEPK